MRRTRTLKSFIQETKNRIKECEEHKRKLHAHSNQLKKLWLEAKISYSNYEKSWEKRHAGKTIKEWFEFYDSHIKECEDKIKKYEKRVIKNKILFFSSVFFIISLVALGIYIGPRFIGFIVQEQEFTQTINFETSESTTYEWKLDEQGYLTSAKLSGLIEGEGDVKIYLDDILIFDNTKSKTNIFTGQTITNIEENGGIFSLFKKLFSGFAKLTGLTAETEESGASPSESSSTDKSSSESASESSESSSQESSSSTSLESNSEETKSSEETSQTQEESSPSQEESPPSETGETTEPGATEEPAQETPTREETGEQPTQKTPTTEEETNETETTEEPTQETANETEEIPKEKPAEEIKTIIEFTDICEDTCDLTGLNLNSSSYTIRIEITNAKLKLKEIKYKIKTEKPEEAPPEIPGNITKVPEIIPNITEIPKNITKVENLTEVNATLTTLQYSAVIGQPVKWKKHIELGEQGIVKINLPKESTNITVKKIIDISEELYSETEEGEQKTPEKKADEAENIEKKIGELEEKIKELEKKVKELEKQSGEAIETPTETTQPGATEKPMQETATEKQEIKVGITGTAVLKTEEKEKFSLIEFFKNIFSRMTGRVIDIGETAEEIEVTINDTALQYDIEYETPAPQMIEEDIPTGKRITIVGPETIHYENILAFTQLSKEISQEKIRLYQTTNGARESVQFTPYDKNNNSLIDYIEWTIPYLSNQTYELIIEISKAEHLNENREFLSDIYEQVKSLDGIWSETILENHFVRVTFQQELDNTKDITIFPKITSGNPRIEVYEKDSNTKIAEFSSLNSNQYNKVFLTNLQSESQDTFDLRIIGGSIEIEHIIDPTNINYLTGRSQTGATGLGTLSTSQGSATAYWITSVNGQYFTWIKQYAINTEIPSGSTVNILFYCNRTETAGGARTQIDIFEVFDCGTSSDCSTQAATICSATGLNLDCYVANPAAQTTSCSVGTTVTVEANNYLGVRLTADINDAKSPDLILEFNSSTYPSNISITENGVLVDNEYPQFSNYRENPSDPAIYSIYNNHTFNATVTSANASVGLEFNNVNYTISNLSSDFVASIVNLSVGSYNYIWWAYGNGSSNKFNYTTTQTYTINENSSLVNLTINATTPQNYGTKLNATCEVLRGDNSNATLWVDGTLRTSGSTLDLNASTHYFNCTYVATQNFTGSNNYSSFVINQIASAINLTLNETQSNITINSGSSIYLNVSRITGDVGSILENYNNGTLINVNETSLIYNLTTFSSGGIYNITGHYNTSINYTESWQTWYVNVTEAANTAPQIIRVFNESISPINLNEGPSNTNITINFSVYDEDGVSDLLNNTVLINFTKSNEELRYNNTCLQVQGSGNYANYSCTIAMWWYDSDGIWTIVTSISDSAANNITNTSTTFIVNTLKGLIAGPATLPFGSIAPGTTNQTATDSMLLNNTGNQDISDGNIDINATDLLGETDSNKALRSGNFSVSNSTGSSVECNYTISASRMNTTSGSFADIIGTSLPAGNFSVNNNATGQERLYFCLLQAGSELSAQSYSTSSNGAWTIRIFLVAISGTSSAGLIRKKKKKVAKDNKLLGALNLLLDELKDEYSLNKKEIIEIIIEKLKEKYNITNKELAELIGEREIKIPITIFSKKLGGLEAMSKYMKENLNLNYHDIAGLLKRDERTIWTSYKKAKEKQPEKLGIKETDIFIPLKIFNNKKLTILEGIILYLKERGMKYKEIARLIERDQRNIQAIYYRALKKRKT